ncbi:MAG: AEC family transporter, partial [Roseburia sp.]|nr:AEC family transporter [Roseburia sp.]
MSAMFIIFESALKQMLVLFLFMAAGYLMGKKEGKDMGKTLSALELYIFMPCLTIESFVKNCTPTVFVEKLPLIGLSTSVLLVFCIPISRLVAKYTAKALEEKVVNQYALCFANSGYMGYPIIGAVFGEKVLMSAMIYFIPFSIATYTYGMYLLVPQKGFPLKKLLNPITIATAIGIILGLSEIPMPDVANT